MTQNDNVNWTAYQVCQAKNNNFQENNNETFTSIHWRHKENKLDISKKKPHSCGKNLLEPLPHDLILIANTENEPKKGIF